jgi:ketosteroid isomerase-like protein
MFCPACGNQVPDDSAVCPYCGNDMATARQVTQAMPPQPQPTQVMPPPQQAQPAPPPPPPGTFPQQPAPGGYPPPAPGQWVDPQTGYPVAPGTPGAVIAGAPPARKSKAGLVIGIIVGVFALMLLCSIAGWFGFTRYVQQVTQSGSSPIESTQPGAAASDSAGAKSPEAGVDAWFAAVAKGDLAAVKKTATSDFAAVIDESTFEGRDPQTSYRISGTNVDGDVATVDVQESPTDAPAQLATIFTLKKQADGTWLISEYNVTATGEPAAGSSPGGSSSTSSTFGRADAMAVVDQMLGGLTGTVPVGDAQAAATDRFKGENPNWIEHASAFSYKITDAVQEGDVWIVTTQETWQSGDETGKYTVIIANGKGLVDARDGLN